MTSAARGAALVAGVTVVVALGAACGPPTSGLSARELWQRHCARCHGEDGRGAAAQRGIDPGLDLTRSQLVANRERGALFRSIAYGQGGMPGFGHKLERGDVELLVDYVLRLHRE
jgi:mono/diheme cytochrome c family protein